jgi:hypothetical protein
MQFALLREFPKANPSQNPSQKNDIESQKQMLQKILFEKYDNQSQKLKA